MTASEFSALGSDIGKLAFDIMVLRKRLLEGNQLAEDKPDLLAQLALISAADQKLQAATRLLDQAKKQLYALGRKEREWQS